MVPLVGTAVWTLHPQVLARFSSGRFARNDDHLLREVVAAQAASGVPMDGGYAGALESLREAYLAPPTTSPHGSGGDAGAGGAAAGNGASPKQPIFVSVATQPSFADMVWLVFKLLAFAALLYYWYQMPSAKGGGGNPLEAVFGNNVEELHERPDVRFSDVKVSL